MEHEVKFSRIETCVLWWMCDFYTERNEKKRFGQRVAGTGSRLSLVVKKARWSFCISMMIIFTILLKQLLLVSFTCYDILTFTL